ncbi:unnamed protein product [Mytilus coruscus]|uniref:Uncharacterized protein n=1 Tax=Mytilus coruscus TaxID=42192 RepID=A0A6J8CJI5_MYTCO|nr:unnamed protein product [Mytilus coruscus]
MKIHFDNDTDARLNNYCSEILVNPEKKVAHSQDFSHNMKKLRNAVLSSGINKFNTRNLTRNGQTIVWEQWINVAKLDEEKNSRRVHYKLTSSHLHPDSAEKMRNHLAEEVLNEDMLHLMKEYRTSLLHGVVLDSAIEYLENTTILISVFRDKRPILSCHDTRIQLLHSVLTYFQSWIKEIESLSIPNKEKEKMLPSRKCLDDVESLISTFNEICNIYNREFPGEGVVPSRFNSDVIENNFCQVRGLHNGNTTNPNYRTYQSPMNSVILGQSSKSRGRKSNAGLSTADPYSFDVDMPLQKKSKRKPLSDVTNL